MMMEIALFLLVFFLPYFFQRLKVSDVRESDIYTRLGWGVIVLSAASFFQSNVLFSLLILIFLFFALLDIAYGWTFRSQVSLAAVEAIFLTHKNEAKEFLTSYFSWVTFAVLVFYASITIYWLMEQDLLQLVTIAQSHSWIQLLGTLLFMFVLYRTIVQKKFHDAFPGVIGLFFEYIRHRRFLTKLARSREGIRFDIDMQDDNLPVESTLVLIIGESSAKRHYSIYGYKRQTNPRLSQMSDLVWFSNVRSAFAQTNPSLSYLLTSASSVDKTLLPEQAPSLIDVAKQLGYETWWLANQELTKSLPRMIAESADHYIYCPGITGEQYDEVVFPYFEAALSSQSKRKLIVVHLLGSHLKYSLRYPESFNHFKGQSGIVGYKRNLSASQIQTINEYDNSILYTDYVVAELVERLKKHPVINKSCVYVADHGEEVYATRNFKGHEPENPTEPMLEVPMFFWSDLNMSKRINFPLVSDDEIYSLEQVYSLFVKVFKYKSYSRDY